LSGGGAYHQDPIAPFLIEHRMDFGDLQTGSPDAFGYIYNYLEYGFRDGARELWARHYLDEPGMAILNAYGGLDWDDAFVRNVMVFLGMRYARMDLMTERGRVPLPPDLAARLDEAVRAHMIRTGG